MTDYSMVEHIDTIAAELSRLSFIGLDTEFMREKTFFAELCLVQVAASEAIYCVDPLAELDMAHFWDSVMQSGWVVHSARQDIEVIYQTSERMPAQLFDTQIAAGLLGYAPQIGYANLVSELFDVDIPKSHTRADWTRRPLSDAVLQYAAEDVEYLLPAKEILSERLDKQGRLEWASEDSALLLSPALYDIDPALAINRMKGARNLRGKRRVAATELAAWRESEALRVNRPRQWIAKDAVLIEIAKLLPKRIAELDEIEDLPSSLLRRSGKQLLAVVAGSDGNDNSYRPPPTPDEEQKVLLKKMQKDVAACADDLGLAAETVASKKELSAVIIGGNRESRVFSGWRAAVIGDSLQKLL
ncbi:MAG: ribonuclease D [Woeseiaceae bacterium]